MTATTTTTTDVIQRNVMEDHQSYLCAQQGRPFPWDHDAFPFCFRFLPIFEKFSDSGKFSKFYLFQKNFLIFIRQNFLWPLFQYISPLFRENSYFPLLFKMSPCFIKIHLLFIYIVCISFPPYFDHDAFMHHPMHVLDAPCAQYYATEVW